MLDESMRKRIRDMAWSTWEVIAEDAYDVQRENTGDWRMTVDEIVDSVTDADMMLIHGGDREAYTAWYQQKTHKERVELIKAVFEEERSA